MAQDLRKSITDRDSKRKLWTYYPDEGPLRRELYGKHLEFFELGAEKKQRLALCANRVGKTEGMGGCEMTYHLTGLYPDWWQGRRLDKAPVCWAAGETAKDVRDTSRFLSSTETATSLKTGVCSRPAMKVLMSATLLPRASISTRIRPLLSICGSRAVR